MPGKKARLTRLSDKDDYFEFDFNPEDLSYKITVQSQTRRSQSSHAQVSRQGAGSTPAGAPAPQEASVTTTPANSGGIQITFTTFVIPPPKNPQGSDSPTSTKTVKERVDQIIAWTKPLQPDGNSEMKGRKEAAQPTLVFSWGSAFIGLRCKLTSITAKYIRFTEEGEPTAANLNMTITETPDNDGSTNPTSGGIAPIRSHIVRAGDSLPSIAFATYGEARYWRALAAANAIDDPLRVGPGRTLRLPTVAELDGAI